MMRADGVDIRVDFSSPAALSSPKLTLSPRQLIRSELPGQQ
jgi:hypothetical protein